MKTKPAEIKLFDFPGKAYAECDVAALKPQSNKSKGRIVPEEIDVHQKNFSYKLF